MVYRIDQVLKKKIIKYLYLSSKTWRTLWMLEYVNDLDLKALEYGFVCWFVLHIYVCMCIDFNTPSTK